MRVRIEKSTARGTVTAPPSKSAAIRFLLCAAIAEGESRLDGIGESADVKAAVDCIKNLSVPVARQGKTLFVQGRGINGLRQIAPLDCGESATLLRFLIPICMSQALPVRITGEKRLFCRPLDEYERLAKTVGATFRKTADGLIVCGNLASGKFTLSGGESSQFVSGLAIALSAEQKNSVITVIPPLSSRPYVELTKKILRKFGVKTKWQGENEIQVFGGTLRPVNAHVEGDHSAAAYFHALNAFGGKVRLKGLQKSSAQGDKICKTLLKQLEKGQAEIDLTNTPDLAPVLFVAAAAKNGGRFSGTNRLKTKESDRLSCMQTELEKCGATMTIGDDFVKIEKSDLHPPKEPLFGHGDHRIVMATSVLLTLLGGEIEDADAVSKSYPDFFSDLKRVQIPVF